MRKILLLALFVVGFTCGVVLSRSVTLNKTASNIRITIDPDGTAFADYTVDYGEFQRGGRITFKSVHSTGAVADAQAAVNLTEGL